MIVPYPEDGPGLPERGPSAAPRAPVVRVLCRLCGCVVSPAAYRQAGGALCGRCWACGRPAGEEARRG